MECQICQKEVKNIRALSTHIQFKHENEKKEYYDAYFLKPNENECKICSEPTTFYLLQYGYGKYCSKECEKIFKKKHMNENNPMRNEASKINQRNTNQKKYGVNQNTQRDEIKEQIKKTNLKKYGVENVIQDKSIGDKARKSREETCMKEHGVKNYFSVDSVKKKIENTCYKKYGVRHISQNPAIFFKQQKSAKTLHHYNGELYYRGSFEKDFLDKFSDKFEIKQGPSFKYTINGKNRTYHSDFYIPSLNLIVEIKNSYLAEKFKESIQAKKESVLKEGYNYTMIVDKKYQNFNAGPNT